MLNLEPVREKARLAVVQAANTGERPSAILAQKDLEWAFDDQDEVDRLDQFAKAVAERSDERHSQTEQARSLEATTQQVLDERAQTAAEQAEDSARTEARKRLAR